MAERLDLVVRGGTVVTADATSATDVGIRDGRIAQLGGSMQGATEIDARGLLVLPGGIDMHVHLSPVENDGWTFPWADDFDSGSRAAAAGGITTIGNITFPRGDEGLLDTIARVGAEAEQASVVDVVLHPVLTRPTPERLAEIPALAEQGHTSIKVFMVLSDFDANAGGFLEAMAIAGRHGVLTLVHCEDDCVINFLTRRLVDEGLTDVSHFARSRPVLSERAAVARAVAFAEAAEAPIYIVHLSSADGLEEAHRAHARGVQVYVETRPVYLQFTSEEFAKPTGPLFTSYPPLRERRDVDALWHGLGCADVHTCCTDHAAWTLEQKADPTLTIETARPGMSDLETLMPLLYSEGVRTGRISLQRFVEITSTNAAKIFGLFPRKGTIAVGADADLVLWDHDLTRVVEGNSGQSRAGYSLYDGLAITGWPRTTISRGDVVVQDGAVVASAGRGRLVARTPHGRL